jgi:rhamnosyltransferase subunit B
MARCLIAAFGSTGDIHPYLAVGRELRRRDHEVVCLANPHFEERIRGAGLEFVPLGTAEEYRAALRDPRLMHRTRAARFLVRDLVRRCVPEMVEFVRSQRRDGDTVVIASATAVGAVLAGDIYRIPTAFVHLAPASMPSELDPPTLAGLPRWVPRIVGPAVWRVADHLVDRWLGDDVNAVRCSHGLPPRRRLLTRYLFRAPDVRVGLFPAWFAPPPDDWPDPTVLLGFTFQDSASGTADDDDDPLDPRLERFLSEGPPPITISLGTANAHGGPVYRAALEAAARLERRALVLTPFVDQLPTPLPGDALHLAYAPFSRVAPRSAVLIHHGGVGTTAQALRAGVPQLVVPRAYDQHDNGRRVSELGCGTTLHETRATCARLSVQLERLLTSPQVVEACRSVAQRFADDPHGRRAAAAFADLTEGLLA